MPTEPMSTEHARIIVFLSCIVAAGVAGYVLKRLGWAKREWAPRLMSAAIIGFDAPIALLAVWHLAIRADVWKVPVAGAAVAIATNLVGLGVARARRMAPANAALFGLQGGMGNVGYTLGGALCFALWGMQGLALEQMFCVMWPFYAFLFCFPIARHYGERAAGAQQDPRPSPLRYAAGVLARSLTDLRSLPLYMVAAGLALNLRGVVPPEAIRRWGVIDALMVAGIFLQFGSVGLTVEARRLPRFWRPALGTAALKFLASPLLMVGAALGLGLAGMPLYVCVLLAAMPTALYSVLMANLFGLNRDLANTTFLLTHILSFAVIIPALVAWLW
ncbi:MAG: AEC family transporter [Phycisphaerae bacterium]|nr:AEC family transporter [Phycisphaerae bacterium]